MRWADVDRAIATADLTLPYRHYSAVQDDLRNAIETLGDLHLPSSPGTSKVIREAIAALVRVDLYLLQHVDE